jgi:hypothetical protein
MAPANRALRPALAPSSAGRKAGGIYNRATYLPEKTAALARWAEHLQAVVTGNPVKSRAAAGSGHP